MIISTKKGTPKEELEKIVDKFEKQGLDVTLITGKDYNVFGLVGDTTKIDERDVLANRKGSLPLGSASITSTAGTPHTCSASSPENHGSPAPPALSGGSGCCDPQQDHPCGCRDGGNGGAG